MNQWLLAVLVSFLTSQLTTFVTEIYLHRGLTHKAIHFNKFADLGSRFILWLTAGVVRKEWVAVHRKHHALADKEEDPHSPKVLGLWKVLFGNTFFYIREAYNLETIEKYARDIVEDQWDKYLFNHKTGLIISTGILLLIFGITFGFVIITMHTLFYHIGLGLVNAICHAIGYKNFDIDNEARNVQLIALLTAGGGLHNNHHAFPNCPKTSVSRKEFDPSWPIIWLLWKFKLCTLAKTISIDDPRLYPKIVAKRCRRK